MNSIERIDDRLVVKTKFNLNWIELFKTLPGHRWDPDIKAWTFPFENAILTILKNSIYPLKLSSELDSGVDESIAIKEKREWIEKEYQRIMDSGTDYKSLTKPFKHQLIAYDFLRQKEKGALLMEMGTGKTKVMIDILNMLWKPRLRILWVCPTSLVYNEVEEFKIHSHQEFDIRIVEGLRKKREKIIAEATNSASNNPCVLLINYEAVRTLEHFIGKYNPEVIILDESTKIKNPSAQVSKSLFILGKKAGKKYILTGTPVTQSPVDIYSQYKFLDETIFGTSFMAFKAKYVIMGGWENREVIGYRNLDEMKEKIFSTGIRFMRNECLDLPEKIYETQYFELSHEQQGLYEGMRKDLVAEYKGGLITAQVAIVKILRLSQITSGFVATEAPIKFKQGEMFDFTEKRETMLKDLTPNPKLELLKSILEDLEDKKVVIWCRFIREIEMIHEYLTKEKRKHFLFYGATDKKARQEYVNEFNKGVEPSVFVGQIQTGGMGINLIGAHHCIYYSNSYSLQDRLQSEDRLHRIGQRNEVVYIDLIGKGTVDEAVVKALKKKKDMAHLITKENLENLLGGMISEKDLRGE